MLYELGQGEPHHIPDERGIDLALIVGEDIALTYDLSPRHFWMLRPECFGDPSSRFANDLQLSFNCQQE